MTPEPTSHHIARSAVWNHLGKVTEFALFFMSTVVVARGLGVEANGSLAGILSFVQLIIVLSSAGIEVSVNKFLPQEGVPNSGTRFVMNRLLRLRVGLYLVVSGVALVAVWILRSEWKAFLGLIIVLGLLRGLAPLLAMLLIARFRTGRAAAVGILVRSAELIALIAIGAPLTIVGVLTVLAAGSALQVLGYAFASRIEWAGPLQPAPVMPVVAFGMVFWLNTIIDYFLGRQGDVMFLTYLRPESSSASLYDVAYSIVQIGMMALTVGLGGVVLAAMAQYAASDRSRMKLLYHVAVRLTSVLAIPMLAFLAVAAPDLIALVYSGAYAGAADVLRILICFRIVSRLFAAGENADLLLALGMVWPVVRIGVVAACVTVGMHLLLIPGWGAAGAALASGTGVLVANALGGFTAIREGGVELQWRAWLRTVFPALSAAAGTFLLPQSDMLLPDIGLRAVVFFGLFGSLLAVTRPLQNHDLDALQAAFGRLPRVLGLIVQR